MNIPAVQSCKIDAEAMPLAKLEASTKVAESDKLKEVSRKFEAILLRQILEETQRPVFTSALVGNSTADGIYRDVIVNQLAEAISKSGTLGLAASLSRELQSHRKKPDAAPNHRPDGKISQHPNPKL